MVLSRTSATQRRPLGGREGGLDSAARADRRSPTGGAAEMSRTTRSRESVMRYSWPVDPDPATILSHDVGGCSVANGAETAEAVAKRIRGSRSFV